MAEYPQIVREEWTLVGEGYNGQAYLSDAHPGVMLKLVRREMGAAHKVEQEFQAAKTAYEIGLPTPQVYEKMAYREGTEGIIAVAKCKAHRLKDLAFKNSDPLIVVLESVEKPGNLGAILRTAEAAQVDAVIVCDPLTDLYNPNLIRASIGGVFSVPTAVCSSKECIDFLKEHQIRILTAQLQDSYDYYDYDMGHATAIVMGTESTGLSQQWREAADAHIRIPMLGCLDSLNVSVSAAILMYEAVRQRHKVYQHPDARM